MSSIKAVERIKEGVRDPKFIFILRNPVDRAISHYQYWKGRGFEGRNFEAAFQKSLTVLSEEDTNSATYYVGGCYGRWLQRYYDTFGQESIHIITTEALRTEPQTVINSCFAFLKVSPIPNVEVPVLNQTVLLKNPVFYRNTMDLMSDKHNNVFKRLYQKAFSDRSRIAIRRSLVHLLEFSKKHMLAYHSPAPLDDTIRNWVAKHYREDIESLKKLTNLSFTEWSEFD